MKREKVFILIVFVFLTMNIKAQIWKGILNTNSNGMAYFYMENTDIGRDAAIYKQCICYDKLVKTPRYEATPRLMLYILAVNHTDEIMTYNGNISDLRPSNVNLTDEDYIKYVMGSGVSNDLLNIFRNKEKTHTVKDFLTNAFTISTIKKMEYNPNLVTLDTLKINKITATYENFFNNLQFVILPVIDTSRITFGYVPNNFNRSFAKTRIKEELSSTKIKDYFSQQLRALNFDIKTGNESNPDTSEFKMVALDDPFHREAFYSSADYYLKIEITNIKYEKSGGTSPIWRITDANFHISIKDVASNKDVSTIDIKDMYEHVSNNTEDDGYIGLAEEFISEQIASQLAIKTIDFTTRPNPKTDFLRIMYNYIASMRQQSEDKTFNGFDLIIYLKKFDENINETSVRKVFDALNAKYIFQYRDAPRYGKNEGVEYIVTRLKNCNINIADFKRDLNLQLTSQLGLSFQSITSPAHCAIYVKDIRTVIFDPFDSCKVVYVYPKRKDPSYTWVSGTSSVKIFHKDKGGWEPMDCTVLVEPTSDIDSYAVIQLNGGFTFNKDGKYNIQIDNGKIRIDANKD